MFRTVSAVLTIAVLVTAVLLTASMPALWALLASTTVALHFVYLLFVMLGALLGLRDPRWLGAHLPGVVWGIVGLATTRPCPVTLLEKSLWEKAGRTPYDGSFLQHYVFGAILPEQSLELVYWAQASFVVGIYALVIRRHLSNRRIRRGAVGHYVLEAADSATKRPGRLASRVIAASARVRPVRQLVGARGLGGHLQASCSRLMFRDVVS